MATFKTTPDEEGIETWAGGSAASESNDFRDFPDWTAVGPFPNAPKAFVPINVRIPRELFRAAHDPDGVVTIGLATPSTPAVLFAAEDGDYGLGVFMSASPTGSFDPKRDPAKMVQDWNAAREFCLGRLRGWTGTEENGAASTGGMRKRTVRMKSAGPWADTDPLSQGNLRGVSRDVAP